jgi:acyl-CoA synthetase (AMP-forming)/AMP-acid ligase II
MLDGAQITCTTLLLDGAMAHGDTEAIVLPGDRVSYADLADGARHWARCLIALGVAAGDHVGIFLPNSTDFMRVLFGAMLAGAVPVPINTRYRGPEIADMVKDADLVAVVTVNLEGQPVNPAERFTEAFTDLADAADPVRLSLAAAPRLRVVLTSAGPARAGLLPVAQLAAAAALVPDAVVDQRWRSVRPDQTGLILYTSGSTSRPKGCLLSHASMIVQGRLMAERYRMTAKDRIWSPVPMFHIGGISPVIAVFSVGGSFLSMARFDAGAGLAMMAEERATISYVLFQTLITDLLHHPDVATHDLSAIRLMVSNLAVQPAWIGALLTERVPGAAQIGTFGLTETNGAACTHAPDDPADDRLQRLGRPLPGVEVRVVDADGQDVATGVIGEVLLRGPSLCSGYYNAPDKTASTLRGGWLYTGDRGSLDERGSVMFHGRLKDVLKVGGENVGALEVEAVVGAHPAVKGCAVVGMPDPRLVEVPVAFVELKPGHQAEEAEIKAFCAEKLASFKQPRRVFFVVDWPMSATKIDKPELVRRLSALALGQKP